MVQVLLDYRGRCQCPGCWWFHSTDLGIEHQQKIFWGFALSQRNVDSIAQP
jgi:hypothetical protein